MLQVMLMECVILDKNILNDYCALKISNVTENDR